MILNITLPWPPSVNTYWRTVNGRMLISADGRAYRTAVMNQILIQRKQMHFDGPLRLTIEAHRPDNRRRDLDNLFKATLDALAHAGVYEDDSQIKDLRIYWADTIGGMLVVQIDDL
ncbi:endodeoxyribonuclease RUS [uncultured Caudovirales phage]|uniref:Crossover junction endodeoxyribonuclease RusA n=1 Tax=uncultured Caudovirales phage TaxID=2100421 RepID=A0A6J5KIY1_9CAUD|nr:endodeoxyribonuclease RUS [uncultured Caudovirales phage]